MEDIFAHIDRRVCFVGHSHIPGIYTEDARFVAPNDAPEGFEAGEGKVLVNVGSVGQPRDGDPRASYCTFDGAWIRFHRVDYDFEKTMNKILETRVLPKILALRLREGR
jgi:diadenosine tetraphosphatase ApaH/serine/threonine PP2A family protein phosphatase